MASESVVQHWLAETCSFKQQTVLLCALRGHDGVARDDPSKAITRCLRSLILKNASRSEASTFMHHQPPADVLMDAFIHDIDRYNTHWLMHVVHACEIIGYKHPVEVIRGYWNRVYRSLVDALHLTPENSDTLDYRLRDGELSPKKGLLRD